MTSIMKKVWKTRKKRRFALERKALDGAAGVLQAHHLWNKVYGVNKHDFFSKGSFTEEELSCRTWEGCNSVSYNEDPNHYRRLNDKVIDYWKELDPNCRVDRIYDKEGSRMVTKICRSNKRTARRKMHWKAGVTAGFLASAVEDNERHKLNENVGEMIMGKAFDKIKALPGMSEEKSGEIVKALTMQTAIDAGRLLGRQEVSDGVLRVLDMKPALIEVDKKNSDSYSEGAKKRRKGYEDA